MTVWVQGENAREPTTMQQHEARANLHVETSLRFAKNAEKFDHRSGVQAMLAQVHATLALVETQRAANLALDAIARSAVGM